ncbi:MAG: hypothetical protein IIA63_12710, partial [Nitrospinae bacterium]|nr:hypothetical protein [Nitrospinota bacterium]
MNKYYKIFIAFVLVLGLWVGLNSLGPASPLPANAQDDLLEDILEGVLEEVREEIKQDIKIDVRRETSEVVAEEQVSPSDSFSGLYVGLIGGDPNTCTFTITPSSLVGRCTFVDGSATISGSSGDGIVYTFSFKLSQTTPPCSASGSGTVKVVSGTGGPGTEILVTAGATACGGAGSG